MIRKIARALEPVSCLIVGTVASLTTPATLIAADFHTPEALQSGTSFLQSIAYVVISVVITGIVTHWVNRAGGRKTKEETNELILKNTKLLLDMKETELTTYRHKIEEIGRELASLKEEVRRLTAENDRLIVLLGKKTFDHDKSSD